MAAKTFWQWYDKELPSGDDAFNFQAAWDAAIESVEENGNSLQQLKAEITLLLNTWDNTTKQQFLDTWVLRIKGLRQLSAV